MKQAKGKRKQEIIDAAIELFAEKGFAMTSLDAIIEASQTSKGTLYHYFSSKEDLYAVVLETMLDDMWSLLDYEKLERETKDTFWQTIQAWWKNTAKHILSHSGHMRLWQDFQENMRSFAKTGPAGRVREKSLSVGQRLASIGQHLGCVRTDLTPRQCAMLIDALDFVLDDWFFELMTTDGMESAFSVQGPISIGIIWRILTPAEQLDLLPNGMA